MHTKEELRILKKTLEVKHSVDPQLPWTPMYDRHNVCLWKSNRKPPVWMLLWIREHNLFAYGGRTGWYLCYNEIEISDDEIKKLVEADEAPGLSLADFMYGENTNVPGESLCLQTVDEGGETESEEDNSRTYGRVLQLLTVYDEGNPTVTESPEAQEDTFKDLFESSHFGSTIQGLSSCSASVKKAFC